MSETERRIEEWVERELTRRRLLRSAGAGAVGLSLASFLAACGGDEGIEGGGGKKAPADSARVVPKGKVASRMTFANWPLYIDVDEKTKRRPTLEDFRKEFGTRVRYVEEINDNDEFYGKIRPQLARGSSGGRDLFVVTDWMAARMKQRGFVYKLDKAELPNVQKNLRDALRKPGYDPNREFAIPWQSGMTGIVYRKDRVGEVKSVDQLFDPRYKGKVTMLTDLRGTLTLAMLSEGKSPRDFSSLDDAMVAVEKVERAAKGGQVRRFTGNDYTRDITKGDAVMAVGWSGDAIQLKAENENVEFALPEEGFELWTDNMQIPIGAPAPYTAQKFMDFVYRPEIAAQIAAYVNYVTPVNGAKEVLAEDHPDLAEDPLIFPTDADLERAHIFKELKGDKERELNAAFQRAIGA